MVDSAICNGCGNCVSPCPTGSIDHWHPVPQSAAYTLVEQFGWDELPPVSEADAAAATQAVSVPPGDPDQPRADARGMPADYQPNAASSLSSNIPPWSAAPAQINLAGLKSPAMATVAGNYRLTAETVDSDIHHIVLDFGGQAFPVLEGQSIGILPPGTDAAGRPHYMRLYSIASPRTGEREGYNNLALTVKRVVTDHAGLPARGVASNYLCDLTKGETVQVVGPFGSTYLMPNHPDANLLMICTGTGAAPMRAMTEHRRRLQAAGQPASGRLMLFFGARNQQELPYFGPLLKLPDAFIDRHFAFSRLPDAPRTYVQDRLREAGPEVAALLRGDSYLYVCGLKGMEAGVMDALAAVCAQHAIDWPTLQAAMVQEGRFHVETY